MTRTALVGMAISVWMALAATAAPAAPPEFQPGAPGAGDPYFPLDGNGGYDVRHYLLDVAYDPPTDELTGKAAIRARATQHLSSFNLDLVGLEVRSITVDGRRATWTRDGQELVVTPRRGIRRGRTFRTVVRYDGVPETIEDVFGLSGFIHTDDGAVVVGQPHVAATWFPANDHPSDKAAYTFRITVPEGLEAVGNGILEGREDHDGRTTWTWDAKEPMASYLATATVGEFDLREYAAGGILYWDALDPDLFDPVAEPRTGQQFAISQAGNSTYKRLSRTISVPAEGAELSFWIKRDTEPAWDFVFVEARTAGGEDWTTLPDRNGHTSGDTGASCPSWHALHPFLTHYQSMGDAGACAPQGSSGAWAAASGASEGYEQWSVDLSAYAGGDVEVSISYASDDTVQGRGAFVDDIVVSTGAGSTSFEDDGDVMDGWAAAGAPEGSPANANDWIAGTVAETPPSAGAIAEGSLARQPEIIAFLEESFGPYPFSAAGGIVDDLPTLGFALENQTRPIYSMLFFDSPESGDDVVVHELAHQWYGDSLAVARWQHIWLNEGFATYAEWLWSEREARGTAQQVFDFFYTAFAPEDPFWQLRIGDPGAEHLFDDPVSYRGAMTLHQLRLQIGDDAFFRLLREWAQSREGDNVTTDEFIALAEQISGMQLD
ncbi:MAG TPA: M1 family aminopeptidase, partial [Solirubrobacteraceae bacterium]|nr:M1 family aminopeptidase [Solirubrobacteraceae bacterium]